MKKRRFLTVLVMIACVSSVVGGHFYYNNKLEETAHAAKLELGMTPKETKTEKVSTKETKKSSENHFANAPKGIAELYKQKKDAGEPLMFHLIGSTNTSTEEGTWAQLFTNQMTESYAKDIEIQTMSVGEMTSLELQEDPLYEEIKNKKSDVFLIEPPLLNDNNGISMKDTLFVLENMLEGIKAANPNAIVLLQPSNPISSPVKYAEQVKDLEEYAKEKEIPYLNYWTSWPDVDSEEIKDYYNSSTLMPNEKGHRLWADYMVSVFK